jgi:uncharacterized lipoprotein YmbA
MHWKQGNRASGLLILLLTMSACTSLNKPFPEKQSYLLEVTRTGRQPALAGKNVVIQVRPVWIAASYSDQGFVYRQKDGTLVSDFYNQFFAPPDKLLTEHLHLWLAGDGLDPQVVSSERDGQVTHLLQTRVLTLLGDYSSQPGQATLEVEFTLYEKQEFDSVPLFRRVYRSHEVLADTSQTALITGWSQGLQSVLTRLDTDLSALRLVPRGSPREAE